MLAGATSGLMDEAKIEAMLSGASDQIDPCLDPAARQAKIGVWNTVVNSIVNRTETR